MKIILDGEKVNSRRGLHKYLQRVFSFPDYYGRNLDALYDCLTDLHEDVELEVTHPATLAERLGPYSERLNAVLRRAAQDNPHLTVLISEE